MSATYSLKMEYMGVNMIDYYQSGGSFISSKLFQKFLEQYTSSGRIIYDNLTLTGDLNCSERGLQYAFNQLENADLFHREFTDETKIKRTGFRINLDKVLEIIRLKPKDVEHLERGNLTKSIVTQLVATLKRDLRGIRKAITMAKRNNNQSKYRKLINKLNAIKDEYRQHREYCIARHEYFLNQEVEPSDYHDAVTTVTNALLAWNFNPPNINQN